MRFWLKTILVCVKKLHDVLHYRYQISNILSWIHVVSTIDCCCNNFPLHIPLSYVCSVWNLYCHSTVWFITTILKLPSNLTLTKDFVRESDLVSWSLPMNWCYTFWPVLVALLLEGFNPIRYFEWVRVVIS